MNTLSARAHPSAAQAEVLAVMELDDATHVNEVAAALNIRPPAARGRLEALDLKGFVLAAEGPSYFNNVWELTDRGRSYRQREAVPA